MPAMLSSDSYAAFVVGFAIMTDSMIYTLVLPFLPDLFTRRLHVPERHVSQWTALAFEAFAVTTLLTNLVVGFLIDASASKSKPFLISILIMVLSTLLFFLGTSPAMIIASRAIQGASTTFTWVTGLAFLVTQVGEGDLGVYVGWTTVGVAIGEIVGPLIGGPVYDYFGHWAAFGIVEALLFVDVVLRVFARQKQPVIDIRTAAEQDPEREPLLQNGDASPSIPASNAESSSESSQDVSHLNTAKGLAWNWLGTVGTLIVIFAVRGALEVTIPLYLIRKYCWTPTKISAVLLTLTVPAAVNPVVGRFTSRQGPRWWSVGGFTVCGAAMLSLANVAGPSSRSQAFFVAHSAIIGIALAILVNANQVAISVASQRHGAAMTLARAGDEHVGRYLSKLSPSVMLSGVTTSWAAGILLGPAYSSLIPYTTDAGWAIFCRGLGGICFIAAVGSLFLWRQWQA